MPQVPLVRRPLPFLASLPREAGAKSGLSWLLAARPLPRQRLRRLQPRQQARSKRMPSRRAK